MVIITVYASKGGVGKTTTTANLGAILADFGMRVLLLDGDIQPSLTRYFYLKKRAPGGLSQMLMTGTLTPECISQITLPSPKAHGKYPSLHPDGSLDIVCSDVPDFGLQSWIAGRQDAATRILRILKNPQVASMYDVVLIDTQGAEGPLQHAAVFAADIILSPVKPDKLSAEVFLENVHGLMDRLDQGLNIGVPRIAEIKAMLNIVDRNTNARGFTEVVRSSFMEMKGRVTVLKTTVPYRVCWQQAATFQVPVHWLDARASGVMHELVWELFPNFQGILSGPDAEATNGADYPSTQEAEDEA